METDGKHGQVQIGTLIKVGDVWRVVNEPQVVQEGQELAASGVFFQAANAGRSKAATTGSGDSAQRLLAELEALDKQSAAISDPEQKAEYVARRADLSRENRRTIAIAGRP